MLRRRGVRQPYYVHAVLFKHVKHAAKNRLHAAGILNKQNLFEFPRLVCFQKLIKLFVSGKSAEKNQILLEESHEQTRSGA